MSESSTARRLAVGFRGDLYRMLATTFVAPPADETVQAMTGGDMADLLADFLGEEAALSIREGDPTGAAVDRRSDREMIRQEYFDLLAVPTDRYLTPFESVYCDQREVEGKKVGGLLNGCSTRQVEKVYAASGLAVEVKELPDHIACELGFMAELCTREGAALDARDLDGADATADVRRSFAKDHPMRWIPRLCSRMDSVARTPFYKGVARVTAALVEDEAGAQG